MADSLWRDGKKMYSNCSQVASRCHHHDSKNPRREPMIRTSRGLTGATNSRFGVFPDQSWPGKGMGTVGI